VPAAQPPLSAFTLTRRTPARLSAVDRDKLRSIGAPRRQGQVEERVTRAGQGVVRERVFWDGRQEARVTPAPVRMQMRLHRSGARRGLPAEVRRMTPREARERHGDE
jgi:hypothetical protein